MAKAVKSKGKAKTMSTKSMKKTKGGARYSPAASETAMKSKRELR